MSQLLFVRKAPQIELEAPKVEYKKSAIIVVGVLTLAFVGMSIALYAMKQPEAGRLVLDLALTFLAWSTGKAVGEKAGVENAKA
jgi:hypothetical protein